MREIVFKDSVHTLFLFAYRRRRRVEDDEDDKIQSTSKAVGKDHQAAETAETEEEPGGVSLTSIMKDNPKLSVQEALAKLVIMKQMSGMPAAAMGHGVGQAGLAGFPGGAATPGFPTPLAGLGGPFSQSGAVAGSPPLLGGLASAFSATNPTAAAAALAAVQMPASLQQTKSQREVYVKGLPAGVTSSQLQEFLSTVIKTLRLREVSTTPIVNAWLSGDGRVGFCETRSVDDVRALIECCDGLVFAGSTIQVGRPKTNAGADSLATAARAAVDPALSAGTVANPLVTSSNVLMMLNLPRHLSGLEIQDFLLIPFGDIKAFNLLLDQEGKSKGSAVFRYTNEKITSNVVAALTGVRLGDEVIEIHRVPPNMIDTLLKPVKPGQLVPAAPHDPAKLSPIICLRNVVDDEDLIDDEAYAEVTEDILEECARYATVSTLLIPRPQSGSRLTKKSRKRCSGIGSIFVEYSSSDDAKLALDGLRKRTVDDKAIVVGFYPRDLFRKKILHSQPLPTLPPADVDGPAVSTAQVSPDADLSAPPVVAGAGNLQQNSASAPALASPLGLSQSHTAVLLPTTGHQPALPQPPTARPKEPIPPAVARLNEDVD